MGNPGPRLAAAYDRRSQEKAVLEAIEHGPLQSLTDGELDYRQAPVTMYPRPQRVKAWVRFGPESVRVDALLMRSTSSAAGIEFKAGERTFRCWVWGNAIAIQEDV